MTWGVCAVTSCEVLTAASCSEWEGPSIPPALNQGQGAETQTHRHSVLGGSGPLHPCPAPPRLVHRSGRAQGNPCDILFPLLLRRSQKALAPCWSCRGGAQRPLSWGMDRPGSSCWTGMKSSSQVRVATPTLSPGLRLSCPVGCAALGLPRLHSGRPRAILLAVSFIPALAPGTLNFSCLRPRKSRFVPFLPERNGEITARSRHSGLCVRRACVWASAMPPVNGEAVASSAHQDGVWGSEMMSAAFACGKQAVLTSGWRCWLSSRREGRVSFRWSQGFWVPRTTALHTSLAWVFARAVSSVWHAGHCVLVNSCPPSSSFVLSRPPCCSAPQTCLLTIV